MPGHARISDIRVSTEWQWRGPGRPRGVRRCPGVRLPGARAVTSVSHGPTRGVLGRFAAVTERQAKPALRRSD